MNFPQSQQNYQFPQQNYQFSQAESRNPSYQTPFPQPQPQNQFQQWNMPPPQYYQNNYQGQFSME